MLLPPINSVYTAPAELFVQSNLYTPPIAAQGAGCIVVKPNWGYPKPSPVTVRLDVVQAVVRGLRAVAPDAEIFILEGVCGKLTALTVAERLGVATILQEDPGVRFADADALPCRAYPNTSPNPNKYQTMDAPALLAECDCRISVGGFKITRLNGRLLTSCALKNLYGLFPRAHYHARSPHSRGQLHRPDIHKVIADVYHTIGVLFDGAVVDATERFVSRDWEPDKGTAEYVGQVLWGDDLLAVDRVACELLTGGADMPDYLTHIDGMGRRDNATNMISEKTLLQR